MIVKTARHKQVLAASRTLAGRALAGRALAGRALAGRALAGRALAGGTLAGTVITGAVLAAAVVPVTSTPADASARAAAAGTRQVSYRGYRFQVPRGWPVVDLAAHPGTCVRFDRHALYLGDPGPGRSCPSGLVGATEAVLVQPGTASHAIHAVVDPVGHRVTVSAPRIAVTATYQTDPGQITAILASAGLPRPARENPAALAPRLAPAGAVPNQATSFTGRGFDACTAPDPQAMQAWLAHSLYRAVGIYIGGSDVACAQPNLTAAWVSQQAAAGWHFVPLYVGPQVSFKGEVTAPATQAIAAAQDAVLQAKLLGFGRGTPIYYDMEAYQPRQTPLALAFFTAWTTEVHALGYRSGIYSSSLSGVIDLANNYTNSVYTMPDVIFDAWWNGIANTVDPNIPATAWVNHRRIHQYSGNITQDHGGVTINIDRDFLDVRFGGGGSGAATRQASAAVAVGASVNAFFTGSGGALWQVGYQPGTGWSAPVRLAGAPVSWPSAVANAAGGVDVFYRGGGGGGLRYLESLPAGGWSQPLTVRGAGRLGSPPLAVSATDGVIDVFWRGSVNPANLWTAQFRPGRGWAAPRLLSGGLASAPSPAVSFAGRVSVFWKGTDGQLWYDFHRLGRSWVTPSRLAMGRLGSGPHAAGQGSGAIDVFWRGTNRAVAWHARLTWGHGWSKPMRIAGGLAGPPFLVASSPGSTSALWKGSGGRLFYTANQHGAGWHSPAALPVGRVRGTVFAAGQDSGIIDAFWTTPAGGGLWHSRYLPASSSWTSPGSLGGRLR
jgi:Rv2525c-like, glycoside hydrolase-like domain